MYAEAFKELRELREDLLTMRGYLKGLSKYRYVEAYQQIMQIAHKIDVLSRFEFGTIVARMERAKYCLSENVLFACADYAEVLAKKTEEHLQILTAKECLMSKSYAM